MSGGSSGGDEQFEAFKLLPPLMERLATGGSISSAVVGQTGWLAGSITMATKVTLTTSSQTQQQRRRRPEKQPRSTDYEPVGRAGGRADFLGRDYNAITRAANCLHYNSQGGYLLAGSLARLIA